MREATKLVTRSQPFVTRACVDVPFRSRGGLEYSSPTQVPPDRPVRNQSHIALDDEPTWMRIVGAFAEAAAIQNEK